VIGLGGSGARRLGGSGVGLSGEKKKFSAKIGRSARVLGCSASSVGNPCMDFEPYIRLTEAYRLLVSPVDLVKNWGCG